MHQMTLEIFGFGRPAPFWTSCQRVACPILNTATSVGKNVIFSMVNQGWHSSALAGPEGLMKWQEGGTNGEKLRKAAFGPFSFHQNSGVFCLGENSSVGLFFPEAFAE